MMVTVDRGALSAAHRITPGGRSVPKLTWMLSPLVGDSVLGR